jgi:hypothetical protein
MGAEIEYEGGWLRRGGWCRWRLAVALACVVAGVLWAAGPASAASRKWTVLNHTFHDLRLEDVKHVEGAPFGFEGRPDKGSILDAARPDVLSKPEPPTAQHFELKWGPDYEAVLIYKIYPTDLFVQFWIKNALDFSDSRCIISHLPYVSTRWAFSYAWPQKGGCAVRVGVQGTHQPPRRVLRQGHRVVSYSPAPTGARGSAAAA